MCVSFPCVFVYFCSIVILVFCVFGEVNCRQIKWPLVPWFQDGRYSVRLLAAFYNRFCANFSSDPGER